MRFKNAQMLGWLLIAGYLSTAIAGPPQTTVSEIKKSLVCLCDCNMTVEACQGAMACQSAEQLTAEVTRLVEQGLSKEAVLAIFIKNYGEKILAAPTKKGFNLTAWILPFVAIFAAGFGIVTVLKRWAGRPAKSNFVRQNKAGQALDSDAVYEKKLDEVLSKLN